MLQYLDEAMLDMKVFFDIEDPNEELTSVEFFNILANLTAYRGAVRTKVEAYMHEHREEIEEMEKQKAKQSTAVPIHAGLTREQLAANPVLGAAPGAGQSAPLFDVVSASDTNG